ncbi:MAG: Minor outer membrane protein Omp16 [Pedosphaera sp.]|nr:Minor outer membrane protein Omp16 [Pedosphaera sp.]
MKLKNLLNLMVLGTALTMTAVGCKHPQGLTPLPGSRSKVNDDSRLGQAMPIDTGNSVKSAQGADGGFPLGPGHTGWNADPSSPLQAQTIYFDYDKASIKSAEQSKLQDVANYMKGHAEVALKVEGNCDERGTEEYNRSLGERRALAAREYLINLGVDSSRIDTISYGEDKAAVQGHDEAAWSKNRRDDFVVLLPPKP